MSWFKRKQAGIKTDFSQQTEVPEGYWVKCLGCKETINRKELVSNYLVCPKCAYHFQMGSEAYLSLLFDKGDYTRFDQNLKATNPLEFEDKKAYANRLEAAMSKTGMNDAFRSGVGNIGGHEVSVSAMDFSFIGGSMGSVVGEGLTRAIKRAIKNETPLIIVSQSGGARMMEGAFSLMQMAKTSAHLGELAAIGQPYFSILTHPTTGGVTASFAMLGDFNLAEPGALIGFAGPRVIRETIGQDLPAEFQRSEFLLEKGFVDLVVSRKEMKDQIVQILDHLR